MKMTFWGVRGSFPVTAPLQLGYGGNTPCLEVEANGQTVIIDAGTGIRALGRAIVDRGQQEIEILLSHTHWDHIHGFPHFDPLYRDNTRITVHSLKHEGRSLAKIFREQQRSPFFPVSLDDVKADIQFVEHEDGETFCVGSIAVTSRRLNHPGVAGGYRLEHGNSAVAYVCDADLYGPLLLAHELPASSTDDLRLEELRNRARDLAHRADWVVCDTFFLADEYVPDWGHSSIDDGLQLAREVDAHGLLLFHHRPGRDDTELDSLQRRYRDEAGGEFDVLASKEGLEISL